MINGHNRHTGSSGNDVILSCGWKKTRIINVDLNRFIDLVNNMAVYKNTYDYYDIFSDNRVSL